FEAQLPPSDLVVSRGLCDDCHLRGSSKGRGGVTGPVGAALVQRNGERRVMLPLSTPQEGRRAQRLRVYECERALKDHYYWEASGASRSHPSYQGDFEARFSPSVLVVSRGLRDDYNLRGSSKGRGVTGLVGAALGRRAQRVEALRERPEDLGAAKLEQDEVIDVSNGVLIVE
ncbi:hypothetical protein ACLOJK_004483, partial [Asimina triloba]